MTRATFLLGVDIGGTKVATLVIDQHGTPVLEYSVPTDISSPDATLQGIVAAIDETLQRAKIKPEQLRAIGVGVPGQVDRKAGEVKVATNLNWQSIAVGSLISSTFHVPCFLENDVRAATIGLLRYRLPDAQYLAYISIGTGIAAGLIIDGKVYRGPRGMAGEIGHISIVEDGPHCACGLRGCLEAMVAGPAIARMAYQAIQSQQSTMLSTINQPLTAQHIYLAAEHHDPVACAIRARVGTLLARAILNLVMSYDIEHIVIGGGVTSAGNPFLESIHEAIYAMQVDSELVQRMILPAKIELVPPSYHAGRWGAVAVAAQAVESDHNRLAGLNHTHPKYTSTHQLPL